MRKFIILIIMLLLGAIGYVGYAHFSGGAVPTFGLPIGGEKAVIRQRTVAFFEHVKFKNSSAFKHFVGPDITTIELSHFFQRFLGIQENDVDLAKIEISHIELDSSQTRARVNVRLQGHNLKNNVPLEVEKLLFLYRNEASHWLIDIKSLAES